MWPRDGALISRSLDRAGYNEITSRFFDFCKDILTEKGYFFHKYRPDGSLGSSWHPWVKNSKAQLPIQEDQLALVLDALWKHYLQHGNKEYLQNLFQPFVRRAAGFIAGFIDDKTGLPKESYDIWEEKLGIYTFTAATVYAGLRAAANFEKEFGSQKEKERYLKIAQRLQKSILKYLYDPEKKYFIKGVFYEGNRLVPDPTIDASSSYGIFEYGVLDCDDERVKNSFELFKAKLRCNTKVGGYARYLNDHYHQVSKEIPGNPWFITILWLAEYYIKKAKNRKDLEPAIEIFEWVVNNSLETGILAEQINPYTSEPLSVAPLTWSHAGFVIAIDKYLHKLDELRICKVCNPPKIKEKKE
jgi:GH15 family glucan-1,4-alpha-glucosidase